MYAIRSYYGLFREITMPEILSLNGQWSYVEDKDCMLGYDETINIFKRSVKKINVPS